MRVGLGKRTRRACLKVALFVIVRLCIGVKVHHPSGRSWSSRPKTICQISFGWPLITCLFSKKSVGAFCNYMFGVKAKGWGLGMCRASRLGIPEIVALGNPEVWRWWPIPNAKNCCTTKWRKTERIRDLPLHRALFGFEDTLFWGSKLYRNVKTTLTGSCV